MSIIKYKCDTCKREVELLENLYGMTVFSKCVITDGCKGKLYVLQRNPDSVREKYPSTEPTLNDYNQRRAFFNFEQSNASNVWKIKHNMSVFPAISVYENINNTLIEIDEENYTLSNVENNQLYINFTEPKFGVAHLVARSSVPLITNVETTESIRIQLTNNGLMTFTIPEFITSTVTEFASEVIDIDLEICLDVPDLEEVVCTENFEPNLSLASPWATWDKILVRNRRFFIPRSKNVLDMAVFDDSTLKLDDIVDGTTLSFKRIQFGGDGKWLEIKSKQLLMLFSESPHARVDKVLDRFVDIGELMQEDENYLIFKNGELFANITNIEATYPNISKYVEVNDIPLPTPTASVTPTPTASLSVPTVTITPTPTPTPTPTGTSTPTPTSSVTPSPSTGADPAYLTGDRNAIITVTKSAALTVVGNLQTLVDGLTSNVFYLSTQGNDDTKWIEFTLSAAQTLTGIRIKQNSSWSHGVWRVEGSTDGISYTTLSSDFTWLDITQLETFDIATGSYGYYRIIGVSGSISQNPWVWEFEFTG